MSKADATGKPQEAWRELVGKPLALPPYLPQKAGRIIRTYMVDKLLPEAIPVGNHEILFTDYDTFMAFAARVKQVHEAGGMIKLNLRCRFIATVQAEETAKEQLDRLTGWLVNLKEAVKNARARKHEADRGLVEEIGILGVTTRQHKALSKRVKQGAQAVAKKPKAGQQS